MCNALSDRQNQYIVANVTSFLKIPSWWLRNIAVSGSRTLEKNSEIFFIGLIQTRNQRPSRHAHDVKTESSIIWCCPIAENRILENNIKISCQPFLKKKKKKKSVKQPDLELGGRGGGNLMVIAVRVCKSVLQTYPIHILGLWKNGPIHILDRLKCWPIYILPFDFYTHLLLVVRQILQSLH